MDGQRDFITIKILSFRNVIDISIAITWWSKKKLANLKKKLSSRDIWKSKGITSLKYTLICKNVMERNPGYYLIKLAGGNGQDCNLHHWMENTDWCNHKS